MKSMEQENNINITYTDENGTEVLLRIEMLTGVSIYGQAGKCREIIDILRQNQIYNKLNKKDSAQNTQPATDPLEQLKKLQQLKEAGVLTDEEFDAKKADLLAKF